MMIVEELSPLATVHDDPPLALFGTSEIEDS